MAVTLNWFEDPIIFNYGLAIGIQKEFARADDGSILNEKHTINLTGQIVANGNNADARYSSLIAQIGSYAAKVRVTTRSATTQAAPLTITGDSGQLLAYSQATLLNISISQPSEETAGLHVQEVSLSFESYNTPSDPASTYKLRSASENFEIKKEEAGLSYLNDDITTNEPFYSYTITHTISAQGLINPSQKEAFEEAYNYVNSRKLDSLAEIKTDNFGRDLASSFDSKLFKVGANSSIAVDGADFNTYGQYNKIRTSSCDLTNGSYSLTTTFFMSKSESNIEITGNFNRDESGDSSVTVDGTIQGLSTNSPTSVKTNKINQARATYSTISGNLKSGSKIYSFASDIYNRYQQDTTGVSLRDVPLNYSFGENKGNGTITFSVSYKVYPSALVTLLQNITGALTATASITDSNRNGAGYDTDAIVIIPIIGRASGPIIQDMGTTKERTRSVNVDVTLEPRYRTVINNTVRSQVIAEVNNYKPTNSELYVNEFQETWDWTSGKYNLNLSWTYVP